MAMLLQYLVRASFLTVGRSLVVLEETVNSKVVGQVLLLMLLSAAPVISQSEPSSEQYKVYSDFLSIQLKGKNGIDDLRVGTDASTLSPNIAAFKEKLTQQELFDIARRLPGVESDVLQSLAECTSKSYRLSRKLVLPSEYALVDPARETGPRGYIEFSCIGMNRSETQAAFFVSRLRCNCAVGKWVLMRRDSKGLWAIDKESIVFIA